MAPVRLKCELSVLVTLNTDTGYQSNGHADKDNEESRPAVTRAAFES